MLVVILRDIPFGEKKRFRLTIYGSILYDLMKEFSSKVRYMYRTQTITCVSQTLKSNTGYAEQLCVYIPYFRNLSL